ncbi:amino acid/polyamine/organocation transporter (APC superfamily) [Rhodoglobus vestalii]|uniref:Amino acid/polyamine/organocation transporter (APC superfamily) n=1 Tax=Rhodoglobus vestalii TaxID=193384 RepID=A0A8H2PXD5_9MICO|nr:amino acid/polyamine/organocation transporter (APC superfamily) [Rhodoglobus vestalii]
MSGSVHLGVLFSATAQSSGEYAGQVKTGPMLSRRLNTFDATMIGLGSMIGAGVFAAFVPAAQAAGVSLIIGLAIAAVVAWCNAAASAQLAAVHPVAGGTYAYGRAQLGPWWGYFAGWSFLVGKTASCAAMALVFAAYVAPDGWDKPFAIAAVVGLTIVNLLGVKRTALATKLIVLFVVAVLVAVLIIAISSGSTSSHPVVIGGDTGLYGILQSAGVLFFAFAGYARVATLGEEVINPRRTIPRAIMIALALTAALYLALGIMMLSVLGADGLARSRAPIADVLDAAGWGAASGLVAITAGVASLGALLALMAGIGRTTFAMSRNSDVPRWLGAVHPRYAVPYRAELVLAATVIVVVLVADLRGAIAFSSFGVLLYYFVANISAFTQPAAQRRVPRFVNVLGATGCLVLIVTVPVAGVVAGVFILILGIPVRLLSNRQSHTLSDNGA